MDDRSRAILSVARSVMSELDLETVLARVLEAARDLTDARYAALGVLDASRLQLARFLTLGMDDDTRDAVGALPTGRGVLGELITHPQPLRVADVSAHPRSYGFPLGHPPMTTFLGVPIVVAGAPYGNLYLTDKRGGEPFSDEDVETLVALADLAGVAIDHARRYSGSEAARQELAQTVSALDATLQISRALAGETDLPAILELVAKRGRALVSARALVIEQLRNGELTVVAGAGEVPHSALGLRVDVENSVASAAFRAGATQRLEDETNRRHFQRHGLGALGVSADAGLVVPLLFRGRPFGALVALDRLVGGPAFTSEDQRLLEAFAASAASALATADSVATERQRQRLAAAEHERGRWARELHDETLQNLAAVRIGLASALRTMRDADPARPVLKAAVENLEQEIAGLRSLITDLRPAALDELGIEAAIRALAERAIGDGVDVDVALRFAHEGGEHPERLTAEVEIALYRIVQEALTNARKHGEATRAVVDVDEDESGITVSVRDDGRGFDPSAATAGFGVLGMRERAELLDGVLRLESAPGAGTTVRATLPARRRAADGAAPADLRRQAG